MIKIDKVDVYGFETAIRGMRNSWNSWDKSDSDFCYGEWCRKDDVPCTKCVMRDKENLEEVNCYNNDFDAVFVVGTKDLALMKKLSKAGTDESKFLRMITVSCDITAPMYWWKQADQYRIGVTTISTSTMHTITKRPICLSDFSVDRICPNVPDCLLDTIEFMNKSREKYLETNAKKYWWQIIQLLPSSYNQKRTIHLNYQVLKSMYHARKNHKLDEWREFCEWIETLPYAEELICCE